MEKTIYYKVGELERVRERNLKIAQNFVKVIQLLVEKEKIDIMMIAYCIYTSPSYILADRYSLDCFKSLGRGQYTQKRVREYFKNYDKLWELKRGLGLFIEHSLVYCYKKRLVPSADLKSVGENSIDFFYDIGEGKYKAVDLKISIREKAKSMRNHSIYNSEIVLELEDIKKIIEAIVKKDNERLQEVLKMIYNNIEFKTDDIYIIQEKNSPNSQFEEFLNLELLDLDLFESSQLS